MVYSKIYLVLGIKVSDEEACKKILNISAEELEEKKNDYYTVFMSEKYKHDLNFDNIDAYPQIQCNPKTDILFGSRIATIHRKKQFCDDCYDSRENCGECFGQTDNGYYDYEKYFNPLVECPIENLCPECFYDNHEPNGNCPRCDHPINSKHHRIEYEKMFIKRDLDKYNIHGDPKVYYVYDACSSIYCELCDKSYQSRSISL
jgi:hypothetical protein